MPFDQDGKYRPNFMEKITGFTLHYKDWAEAGYPRRDPEYVRELFHTHCNPPGERCEYYDPDDRSIPIVGIKGICTGCGCHVSDDALELTNALGYPTKECPLKKFAAMVDPPKEGGDVGSS